MPNALRVSGSQSSNVTKSCSPCRPPSHWVRSLTKTQDRERVSYRDPRFQLAPSCPPFDNILDRFTGSDPSVTDYVFWSTRRSVRTVVVRLWKRLIRNRSYVAGQSRPASGGVPDL